MKNHLKIVLPLLGALALLSCGQDNDVKMTAERSEQFTSQLRPSRKFDLFLKISKKHSEGLDRIYDTVTVKAIRLDTLSREKISETLLGITESIVTHDTELQNFNSAYSSQFEVSIKNPEYPDTLSTDGMSLFLAFHDKFLKSSSYDEMETEARNLIETRAFMRLDVMEQDVLMFMLCVALDSYDYWTKSENLGKWEALVDNKPYTRGPAGPPGNYWIKDWSSEQQRRISYITFCDGVGALASGINPWGWLISGIVSSATSLFS